MSPVALVRAPTAALARCELEHVERAPIDVGRAREQHAAYVEALGELGAEVVTLEPLPAHPDACFVEDCAVVLDDVAVVGRPGVASRRGEVPSVAAALGARRALVQLGEPCTLEGGDVLRVDDVLYVGWSRRTNHAGLKRLAHLAFEHGAMVKAVEVGACLHLKTALTSLGDGRVLAHRPWLNVERVRDVEWVDVDPDEPFAANVVVLGGVVLAAAGHPRTRARLEALGYDVCTVALDELAKAEAGPSCLSLLVGG